MGLERLLYGPGDEVVKVGGGDHAFRGKVVGRFWKLSGEARYVVEDAAGELRIFREGDLAFAGLEGLERN
jgi:hypothetical protein